ncbi:MAG TPA: DUF4242 domain-containing protein [Opitutaceae bacterium]
MNTYVILRRSGWATPADLEKSAGISARVANDDMPADIRWIRSYVTNHPDGSIGTVCIYEATSIEAIREHARRARLPITDIHPVRTTVIINEDTPAAA